MARWEIIIDKNGDFSIEGFGFEGSSCYDRIDDILREMGDELDHRKKEEYYIELVDNIKLRS